MNTVGLNYIYSLSLKEMFVDDNISVRWCYFSNVLVNFASEQVPVVYSC